MTPTPPAGTGAPLVRVGYAHAHSRQRKAHRPRPAFAVIGVRRDHAGFGHAVALENGKAGALPPGDVSLGEQRRRARDEQAHVGADSAAEAGMVEQAGIEGRNPHQRRRFPHRRDHRVRIEPVHVDHRRPRQKRDIGRHEQPVGMKNRQRVDEPVGVREAPAVDQRQRVRRQIFVRQHRALGAAGRARGVEDRRQIVGSARDRLERRGRRGDLLGEGSISRDAEALDRGQAELRCERSQGSEPIGPAERQRGLGVAEEIFELGERIGGVQRQKHGAGAKAGERDHDRVGGFLDLRRDPVAGPDPELNQRMGRPRRPLEQFAIGQVRGV